MSPSHFRDDSERPTGIPPLPGKDDRSENVIQRVISSLRDTGTADDRTVTQQVHSSSTGTRAPALWAAGWQPVTQDRPGNVSTPPAPEKGPLPGSVPGGPQQSIVVIDCSPSMEGDDYPPTRLAAAMDAAREYVQIRSALSRSDLIAIVSFCGKARTLCSFVALPGKKAEALDAIGRIEVGNATSIGAGLLEAERLFSGGRVSLLDRLLGPTPKLSDPGYLKRVILLTDGGQNTNPDPIPVADRLKKTGVLIDSIGIGARHEVDEPLLRQIASVQNGQARYRFISDRQDLLEHYRRLGGSLTR